MSRWLLAGLVLGILAVPVLFAALAAGGLALGLLAVLAIAFAGGLLGLTGDEEATCHRCGTGNDHERAVCVECGGPF